MVLKLRPKSSAMEVTVWALPRRLNTWSSRLDRSSWLDASSGRLVAMRQARITPFLDHGQAIEISAIAPLAYELD